MITNRKSFRRSINANCSKVIIALIAITFLAPIGTFGQLNLWDREQGLPDLDARVGSISPTADQLSRVKSLGARAEWNKFGTIHTMTKYGGFLATGLSGDPVSAAREWIRSNRVLFRLSDQGVTDLELVSDGTMPHSAAHAVLFRQRFGGLPATQDGLINVAIVNGKVYHVWSSSAGDQAPPGTATLTPVQAWIAAAASINRFVPVGEILSAVVDKNNNWTVLKVVGFPQDQQVRLTALPTPIHGVRSAYEANVVYVQGHIADAYTVFVDAQTGEILHRVNRTNWAAPAPETTVFQGTYSDAPLPLACGPKHSFVVGSGKLRIVVTAAAAIETNDIVLKLYEVVGGVDVLRASADTATSPEAITYEPAGGIVPATYKVEICPYTPPSAPPVPPYNYVGTFTTDDAPVPGTEVPAPQWKYFFANPLLNFASTDVRKIGCWSLDGTAIPGCDRDERNTSSRAPWDYDFKANTFTNTTRGNNAQTSESWGSPLTPSTPYSPVPTSPRQYNFPWFNEWKTATINGTPNPATTGKGCFPVLDHTSGNDADIDAAVTHLFATHNRMHDWSYFLGFTEVNSNLQLNNFGNTQPTRENDPEVGNAQAGAVSGGSPSYLGRDNANQITLQDGVPGITNQYLFQPIAAAFYSPCVDGDMDVGIVAHEYTHAISNRMVGGPDTGLTGAQAGAMGESWSDLDAAEYLFEFGYVPTSDEDPTAVGIYATGNKKIAIRNFSLATSPLNYSNIGYDISGPQVHADGEIWGATNWEVRQALVDKYNAQYPYTDMALQQACAEGKKNPADCPGNRRWIQLVFDAFLLQPGATSMLDARDAMLAADVARFGGANQVEIWRAFSKRGMGGDAYTNGTGDGAPIPNFDSPVETNDATITFNATAQDEGNAAITNAKIIVGRFQTRSRAIADTNPATVVDNTSTTTRRMTLNRSDTAKFVPGTYELIVQAPGYGIQRFTRTFTANQTATISFSLPTNRASISKGATATSSGTAPNNIIDDTEDTGSPLGTTAPVAGKHITVDLQGSAPVTVSSVNVSTAAGPTNGGRFTGVRKFEIRTCNGTCADPVADFTNVAFTSADDAFPADIPRPAQPQMNLRSFTLTTPTLATHVQLRVLTNQCTGQTKYHGDQDDDPNNNSDCLASPAANTVRATELEVFASCNRNNVAASAVGATASASSEHGSGLFPAASAINGDRTGQTWGMSTGGWNDNTRTAYPDSLQVNFSGAKTINEIRVYTLPDTYKSGAEPTLATTAISEGILDFTVEYYNGSAWVQVPGGMVTGNTKAINVFTFPDIVASQIRVVVTNSRNFYSRIVEVEAFSCQ